MRIGHLGLGAGLLAALMTTPTLGRIVLTGEPRRRRVEKDKAPAVVEAEPLNPSRQVRRAKERDALKASRRSDNVVRSIGRGRRP